MTTFLVPFAPSTPALPAYAPAPAGPIDDRAERVARGAALWDETQAGWEWEIALENLDMTDCWECTVGQLRGYFYQAVLEMIGVPIGPDRISDQFYKSKEACVWAHDHGFYEDLDEDYPALRNLWVAAILARRGTGTGAEV